MQVKQSRVARSVVFPQNGATSEVLRQADFFCPLVGLTYFVSKLVEYYLLR